MELGLIRQLKVLNTREVKGTTYQINTGVDLKPRMVKKLMRSPDRAAVVHFGRITCGKSLLDGLCRFRRGAHRWNLRMIEA